MKKLEIKKKSIRNDLSNLGGAISFVYKSDSKICLLKLGLMSIQSTLPLAMLYLLKLLVDSITPGGHAAMHGRFDIPIYAGLFCAAFFAGRVINVLNQYSEEILLHKLTDFISSLIHEKSIELDLAYYDNPEYHDSFHRAQEEAGYRPVQILSNLAAMITNVISLLGIVIILVALSWSIVIVLVLAGLPLLWSTLGKFRALFEWRKANTALFRKANYFSALITHRNYAKELRVFNLGGYFRKKYVEIRGKLVKAVLEISRKKSKNEFLSAFLETAALLLLLIFLAGKSSSGVITTGSFVMYFEAFRRGQGFMQGTVSSLSGLYNNKLFLNNLFEFLALKSSITTANKSVPFPAQITRGIRFENVSFGYPGSEGKTIKDLSFKAEPGKVTFIHGENGSGKTTLIKLLCRIYDRDSGAIYIDGIDINDFDLPELRKNISVIFQDFDQFDLTASENITIGDVENMQDFEKLRYVSHLSSADKVISKLPAQYDTILGKYFEKGEELSMGQWQRIALARALYKDAPILVLDEPTSWMDEKAESSFYQNLDSLAKDKILLVISPKNTFDKRNAVDMTRFQ